MSGPWWVAVTALVAASAVASLPYWLPDAVVALRVRIFAWVNGEEGVPVPGGLVGTDAFKRVYSHPAADGRSRGAALSDLFWYWLAPGPEVHQEHLEPGPRYEEVARSTREILTGLDRAGWAALVSRRAGPLLDALPGDRTSFVRLRDLMMPLWAEVYYELVFAEPCPAAARELIVANADDVVSALKCTRLRHMGRRDRLTRYLAQRIAEGAAPDALPASLTAREQGYYLQGTFFNTAVVQMSEAMAHLLLAIAAHPEVQLRLRADPDDAAYLDRVIDEVMRLYPLFGVAHRITSADIAVDGATIPTGSVLLFNYAEYQHAGLADGDRFDPDRWLEVSARDINFLPYGVSANRPCPARGIAPIGMRVAAREVLRRFVLSSSAVHSRSLPSRGPCLLAPVGSGAPSARPGAASGPGAARLALLRLRDRWEGLGRSIVQLVLGSYMVWDARRRRLCQEYFASQEQEART
ncbi:cytochrome P450 [Streptacidiphilus sp. N1-12]|uniref:Cytochrome P450 n=2 Tax=Streptacidiphilus alkalitolerans TaxID=3342712 RepID=A0ABV6W9S9_9ACTN